MYLGERHHVRRIHRWTADAGVDVPGCDSREGRRVPGVVASPLPEGSFQTENVKARSVAPNQWLFRHKERFFEFQDSVTGIPGVVWLTSIDWFWKDARNGAHCCSSQDSPSCTAPLMGPVAALAMVGFSVVYQRWRGSEMTAARWARKLGRSSSVTSRERPQAMNSWIGRATADLGRPQRHGLRRNRSGPEASASTDPSQFRPAP